MLGWFVWAVENSLCCVASYIAAAAMYSDRTALDRFIAAGIVGSAMIVLTVTACGAVSLLDAWHLGILSTALFVSVGAVGVRSVGGLRRLAALARNDFFGAPARLFRDTFRQREVGILTLIPAGMAAGICCLMVWYFRSWTWDPVWYHDPKIYMAIQEHTLRWFALPNPWTNGNPHNVELIAIWNCIFQRDNRLDDSAQIPYLFLGAAVVAAWARKVGATRPIAAAVAATWIALPPIYLEAHSTHNDVAWSTFFTAAVYFTLDTPSRRDRWMCYAAWGLFIGAKYTGLFHVALAAPILFGRLVYELWKTNGSRILRAVDAIGSIALVLGLAAFKYVQNWRHTHNPMWPFVVRIQSLGLQFPGTSDPAQEYGSAPGTSPTFFGAPNAFQTLLNSWYNDNPFYCPDVRHGGFGTVWRWLLLPCMVVVIADMVRGRHWKRNIMVVVLFVQTLQVPVPYMSRFTMAAATATLVAFAMIHADARHWFARVALSSALVAMTWIGYREGYRGFIVYPRYFAESVAADPVTRASMQIDTFLWPREWALARERELRHGEVLAYDESVHFLGDLWNHDFSNRVLFVSSEGNPRTYVDRLRHVHARWAGVSQGSAAEMVLRTSGAEYLFRAPDSSMVVYRLRP